MLFDFQVYWIWPALMLAFFIGYRVASWWFNRKNKKSKGKVNQEYFKGLNFLLNEQPDKAIEVFIQALEVDSETVELHLALGGLFRRKGEVDRATRIHQNLIARPNLTDEQRLHAICELAQDYYKAGLLDRAENLYLELKDTFSYRKQAIEGLSSIYQKEKDWQKAIDIMRLYKRSERSQFASRISHYWCELAQEAIDVEAYHVAKKHLRSAVNEDRSSTRAILLKGQVCFQQGDYQQAIDLWQSIASSNVTLSELVTTDMIACYGYLNDSKGLRNYLLNSASLPKNFESFKVWQSTLFETVGEERALEKISKHVQNNDLNHAVSEYLLTVLEQKKLSSVQQGALLSNMLNRAKVNNIEYNCHVCGFDAKAMHWHCPNCDEWDSFS